MNKKRIKTLVCNKTDYGYTARIKTTYGGYAWLYTRNDYFAIPWLNINKPMPSNEEFYFSSKEDMLARISVNYDCDEIVWPDEDSWIYDYEDEDDNVYFNPFQIL